MSETPLQSWSVIIPCFNEEGNIERVVQEVQDVLEIISKSPGEIVIVNDGSTDNSHQLILELLKKPGAENIRYVHHDINKGIGEALHSGYSNAGGDNVVMVPGDGQFDIKEFIPYKNLPEKTILAFYRIENTTYTISRNILSWVNNTLNRIFNGITLKDVNWVKVYKNSDLKKLKLEIRSSLVESEICAKLICLGHQPLEVQSKYLPRQSGKSKGASFKIIRQAILDIIRLIGAVRRFRKKVKNNLV